MSNSKQPSSTNSENNSDRTPESQDNKIVDSRDLVYRGGTDRDPRELVENPAVAPEMVDQAPDDLRDDLMPKQKSDLE